VFDCGSVGTTWHQYAAHAGRVIGTVLIPFARVCVA
jgi:hypothetical protein